MRRHLSLSSILLLGPLACPGNPTPMDTTASDPSDGSTTACVPSEVDDCKPDPTTSGTDATTSTTDATTTTTGTTGDTTDGTGATGTTSTGAGSTTGDTTGGDPVCMDAVAQSFVPTGKSFSVADLGGFPQGTWYDPVANRICTVIYNGVGECFTVDGTSLGPIKAPSDGDIDGAIYDAEKSVVLFIQQDCLVIEADPSTMKKLGEIQLDPIKFGLKLCTAIALTPANDLYIASYNSGEVVAISRDGKTELGRIDVLAGGISGPDGLNVISGAGDLLLLGTGNARPAAIFSASGQVLVPASEAGQDKPPIKGGALNLPDDTLTLCENGHLWVCDQSPGCVEYAPEDGDKNICGCFQECAPKGAQETVCDGVDDDCNGAIDDLDAGGDGICDCDTVAVLGKPGNNPHAMFEAFLDEQSPGWVRHDDLDPLTAEALADIDTLVLDNLVRDYTDAEALALRDWVLAGGGLMAMAGYSLSSAHQNSLLEALELQFEPTTTTTTVKSFAAHPLTKAIKTLPCNGGHPVVDVKGDGLAVAFDLNKKYGLAAARGLGRVYLYADEWVTFDQVWDAQAEQFWLNALAWLSAGGGNCALAPVYPETCTELLAEYPGVVDGLATLYIGHSPSKPWTAYCRDMAGTPKEYLPLVKVGPDVNFSQFTAGGIAPGTDVRTAFTRVRIDPLKLTVDIDDLTFTSSQGSVTHVGKSVTAMPFGVAMDCAAANSETGEANIDLTGTPFKLNDPFCTSGVNAKGQVTFGQGDQVVDLTGGGFCGWTSPKPAGACTIDPDIKPSGSILELDYVGP